MSQAKIETLTSSGVGSDKYVILPRTHTKAVFNDNGESAESVLSGLSANKVDKSIIGPLSGLTTSAKTSIIAAINEINAKPSGSGSSGTGKPSTGWSKSDLATSVQASLNKADNSYQIVDGVEIGETGIYTQNGLEADGNILANSNILLGDTKITPTSIEFTPEEEGNEVNIVNDGDELHLDATNGVYLTANKEIDITSSDNVVISGDEIIIQGDAVVKGTLKDDSDNEYALKKDIVENIGSLSSLTTSVKTSVIAAINEINAKPSGGSSGTGKPSSGWSKSDLSTDVQASLDKIYTYTDEYISNANEHLVNGYIKTNLSTTNLPTVGADKYGVLQFVSENETRGTGTQNFYPIDGTYKGRTFTRSLTNMLIGTAVAGKWHLHPTMDDVSGIGALSGLTTENKTTLVDAINELNSNFLTVNMVLNNIVG